jgi:hypothetical protein
MTTAMSNAQLVLILFGLRGGPRPLADLLPGLSRSELRDAADYLKGTGLAWVKTVDGVLVAEIAAAGQMFVKKNRDDVP